MAVYRVANVYNAETNTISAETVQISHSLPILGTNDIVATIGDGNITTTGNEFASLGNLYVIRQRNWANVFVGKIGNVVNGNLATLTRNAVADITNTGITAGTGSLSVRVGSREVRNNSGSAKFLYELDADMEIYRYNSLSLDYEVLGTIETVISNTRAIIKEISATQTYGGSFFYNASPNWKYQTYSQAKVDYDPDLNRYTEDPNRGNGAISIFTANSSIIGNNTIFTQQFTIGAHIFGNTYTADEKLDSFLGIISRIVDDTNAEFTTASTYDLTDITYKFYDSESKNKSNIFTKNQDAIHSSLIKWSRSGLIPNLKQIKAYHPPVQDPVTGILCNFPATVHVSNPSVDVLINNEWKTLDETPHTSHTNPQGTTIDFDAETGAFGTSLRKAIDSIPINNFISKLANNGNVDLATYNSGLTQGIRMIYGDAYIPPLPPGGIVVNEVPAGFTKVTGQIANIKTAYDTYIGPGANTVYKLNANVISNLHPTICDTFAVLGGVNIPQRITDRKDDALTYFSAPDLKDTLTDAQKADLAARTSKQFSAGTQKKFIVTGCPAAIPGQLNVILLDENPANRAIATPTYTPEMINLSNPPEYNPDLPVSIANEPPFPL